KRTLTPGNDASPPGFLRWRTSWAVQLGKAADGCLDGRKYDAVNSCVHQTTDALKAVGVIIGFIYGTVNIFRYGAGSQGVMRTLGQYMGASGATFGFFMSIGSVIRSDVDPKKMQELYLRAQQRRPIFVLAESGWRKS
ncbi:hypothetical protein L249_0783, partial [Ophiocordyceps polyrhachis-furcata BCC 54312]